MSTGWWAVAIVLAVLFVLTGAAKIVLPREKLAKTMVWTKDMSSGAVKAIGLLEVLGAAGLILPALTGILPVLSGLAAVGLALVMVGAIVTNVRYAEYRIIPVNLILLGLSLAVAGARFGLLA
ncbi:MAG: DoxX family protein [Thermoflexales bacterium]|nr:DoxX family protein [Thermoflexales bacterium]